MTAYAQRSFAAGELAPAFYARTDHNRYASGLRTLRNCMVKRSGGVTNRPGTELDAEVKDSTVQVRLIEFLVSETEGYVLEFGNLYMRVHKLGAPILVSGVAAWSAVVTYGIGDIVSRLGVNYVSTQINNLNQQPPNASYWHPLTGAIYEIPSPYTTADLAAVQYAQSDEILTLVHPSYEARELERFADTDWILSEIVFGPSIGSTVSVTVTGGAAGVTLFWAVSAIDADTFEEGTPTSAQWSNRVPSAGTPSTVTWPAVTGAGRYKIFRSTDGVEFGYLGSTTGTTFEDVGNDPDYLHPAGGNSPTNPFVGADHRPSTVTYYQQRRFFGNSNLQPETVWGSRTGFPKNFNTTFPLQADDAVTFTLVGRKKNAIRSLLDLGRLVAFTMSEEKMIEGDDAGIIRPDAINPRKLSSNGAAPLRPLELDDSALYVQGRGTLVRDLKPVSADAYEGTDLTVFADHLFQGYTLADWDFAENPHSIVWIARSDGLLLGLTYLREHAIWGWHRHDTDGLVENVCVVPEGATDAVYLIVKRTIGGVVKRYIERMASRFITDQEDMVFMDCAKSYNGWNVAATTITLTAVSGWTDEDLLTATASAGVFTAGDVDNIIILRLLDTDGEETDRIRFRITSYTSATVVKGFADKTVPTGLRAIAKTTWALAKKIMTGLSHLEGKSLAVLGDGYVVASPNNNDPVAGYPTVTVTGGSITLPAPYAKIQAGLPYISDIVTLDLDVPGSQTIKDKKMLINRLGIYLEATRGVWAGMPDQPTTALPLKGLQEYKARYEEDYGDLITPKTDYVEIGIEARADENGRQMIRQVDPLPITVLAIMPMVK